jgi:hypothetical protein
MDEPYADTLATVVAGRAATVAELRHSAPRTVGRLKLAGHVTVEFLLAPAAAALALGLPVLRGALLRSGDGGTTRCTRLSVAPEMPNSAPSTSADLETLGSCDPKVFFFPRPPDPSAPWPAACRSFAASRTRATCAATSGNRSARRPPRAAAGRRCSRGAHLARARPRRAAGGGNAGARTRPRLTDPLAGTAAGASGHLDANERHPRRPRHCAPVLMPRMRA